LKTATRNLSNFQQQRSQLVNRYLTYQSKVPEQGWVGTSYDTFARQFEESQQKLAGFINQLNQLVVNVNNQSRQVQVASNQDPTYPLLTIPPSPAWRKAPVNTAQGHAQGALPDSLYSYSRQTTNANNQQFTGYFLKNLVSAADANFGNAPDGWPDYCGECASVARAIANSLRWQILELDARVGIIGQEFEKAGSKQTLGDPHFRTFQTQQQLDKALDDAAAQAGKKLASQVKGSRLTDAQWNELRGNDSNPAFTTAFFNSLDPRAFKEVVLPYTYQGLDATDDQTQTLATALASAYGAGHLSPAIERQLTHWGVYSADQFLPQFLTALSANPQASMNYLKTLNESQFDGLASGSFSNQYPTQSQAAFLLVCATVMREEPDPSSALQFMDKVYNAYTATSPRDLTEILPALGTLMASFYSVYLKAPPTFPANGSEDNHFENGAQLEQFIHDKIAGDAQTGGKGAAYYAWGFSKWIYSTNQATGSSQVFTRQLAESVVLGAALALIPGVDFLAATVTIAAVENAASGWAVPQFDSHVYGTPPDPQDPELKFYETQAAYSQVQVAAQLLASGQLSYVDPVTGQKETIAEAAAAAHVPDEKVLTWLLTNGDYVEIAGTTQSLNNVMTQMGQAYLRTER